MYELRLRLVNLLQQARVRGTCSCTYDYIYMNYEHVFPKRRNTLSTERVEKLLLVLIGWQAYRGDQRHRKKQPYITLKSNPSKEKKTLAGPICI